MEFIPVQKSHTSNDDRRYKIIIGVLAVLLVVAAVGIFILVKKVQQPLFYDNFIFKQAETFQEVRDNIEKVVNVPAETPNIAQIADIDYLKQQSPTVYANAANDDIVFVYSTVIVIYRPENQRIVSVIPVTKH